MKHPIQISLMFVAVLSTGCAQFDQSIGQMGAKHGSYDVRGERVEVQFLTTEAFKKMADDNKVDLAWVDQQFVQARSAALAAILIPELVKIGYDVVVEQIKAEAARYEQQFSGTVFVGDYWSDADASKVIPRYRGFVVRRYTAANEVDPAFTLLCALIPRHKQQFVEVAPLLLLDKRPKAKIVGDAMNIKMTIAPKFQWVDSKGELHNESPEPVVWEMKDYLMKKRPYLFNFYKPEPDSSGNRVVENRLAAGSFVAPPMTHSIDPAKPDAKPEVIRDSGLVHLTVTVDERDTTDAQAYVKKVQKVAEENKDQIVKIIVEAAIPSAQPTTKPAGQ